jgi:exosortase/archaeosortase family protein
VYSFWIAFVAANKGKLSKKILWIVCGVLALWLINVIRITLFLTSINKGWPMPLGIDHHTWFNIFAYLLIFVMIWMYDRSFRRIDGNIVRKDG